MNEPKHFGRRGFIKITVFAAGGAMVGLPIYKLAEAAEADIVGKRQGSVYSTDAQVYKIRKSQDNPMIKKLYDPEHGFLKEGPCGHKSHQLLHTHYTDRSAGVKALKAKGVKLNI